MVNHNPKPGSRRFDALLAAAKAHDTEEAAQKGEPSPWSIPEAAGDETWRGERVAAMSVGIEAFKKEMEPRHFRNIIAILCNIDCHELEEAGIITPGATGGTCWDRFNKDVCLFILKLDDDKLAALWALIESRQP